MSETQPSPEAPKNLRELATEAYKQFVNEGAPSPDDLEIDRAEVQAAQELFEAWTKELDEKAAGDPEAEAEANFAKTVFYYEVGFRGEQYLLDVIDWLNQDLDNVDENSGNHLPQIAEKIKAKIAEIEGILQKK